MCHWVQFMFLGTVSLNSIYVSCDSTIEFNLCFMGLSNWVQFMLHGTIQLRSIYVSCDSTIEVNSCFLGLSHWVQFMFHVTLPLCSIYVWGLLWTFQFSYLFIVFHMGFFAAYISYFNACGYLHFIMNYFDPCELANFVQICLMLLTQLKQMLVSRTKT